MLVTIGVWISGTDLSLCAPIARLLPNMARSINFYGSASGSKHPTTSESPWMLELCNCGQGPWGSVGVELRESLDLSRTPLVRLRIRGVHGGERLWLNLRDQQWNNPYAPQASSDPFPQEGLSPSWQTITLDLRELKGGVDLTQVQQLSFEIGSETAGNPQGARLTIADILFSGLPEEPAAISPQPLDRQAALAIPLAVTLGGATCLGLFLWGWRARQRNRRSLHPQQISPMYELNMRTWGATRDAEGRIRVGQFRAITARDLRMLVRKGFRAIWIMGIWKVGERAKDISKRYAEDFVGSPFAISDYTLDPDLGTADDFRALVSRAHREGLKVLVDFVPNHTSLDSRLLAEHPELFIHRVLQGEEATLPEEELLRRHPHYYFVYEAPNYPERGKRGKKRILVAHGNDPHFYPWIDTAQLDYAHPELRRLMVETLKTIARLVDGVRCDMAMLVLREQVKRHRHPDVSWEEFNRLMPREFWEEAIPAVKAVTPRFIFIAESYWNLERYLQQLGFDLTYNKQLYDHLRSVIWGGEPEGLMQFLRDVGQPFLERSLHFLENHDEERAITTFGDGGQRAAAVLVSTLPGVLLVHQGQLEGWQERLPVQRVIPLSQEPPHPTLPGFYEQLLRIVSTPLFQTGTFRLLPTNNRKLFAASRRLGRTTAIVVINLSNTVQRGSVTLPAEEWGFQRHRKYQLKDLFYPLKPPEIRARPTVTREYRYLGSELIQEGLYVELDGFDAHILKVHRGTVSDAVSQWQWFRDFFPRPVAPRGVSGEGGATTSGESDVRREAEA
ncbi:MAG: hypothetical protein HYZ73_02515 [Elusimicrobia bacterium]|nr:hypothetical protein [Elusimicrobiota bacterium]